MYPFPILVTFLVACASAAAQDQSTISPSTPSPTRYIPQTTTITPLSKLAFASTSLVTVTITSWTTTVVTVTDFDTVIETVTQWIPPPTPTSTIRLTTPASSTTSRSTTQAPLPEPTQTKYGQCGGSGYTGATKCAAGSSCSAVSPPWYYQCL